VNDRSAHRALGKHGKRQPGIVEMVDHESVVGDQRLDLIGKLVEEAARVTLPLGGSANDADQRHQGAASGIHALRCRFHCYRCPSPGAPDGPNKTFFIIR